MLIFFCSNLTLTIALYMWYFRLNKLNCQVTYPNTFEIVFAELSVGKDNSFRFPVSFFF